MLHTKRGTLLSLVTDQTDKQTSTRSTLQSAQGTTYRTRSIPLQSSWLSGRTKNTHHHGSVGFHTLTRASGTHVERPGPRANSRADSVAVPHLLATTCYVASL